MSHQAAFTPYQDVNELLHLLLKNIQDVLGPDLVALYLYGSLSSGDFDPHSSDIDFAAITRDLLTAEQIAALDEMHQRLWASGLKWAAKLEGAYPPVALIRRRQPDGPACPTINEGAFYLDRLGSDWVIQRHVMRECGVVLFGPPPAALIDPVAQAEIRAAIQGVLDDWWFPMLGQPAWLTDRGPEYHAYAVISMCRVLHGLTHGKIVSKPVAARWMIDTFPEWRSLIEKALSSQDGSGAGFAQSALSLILFVQEQVRGL